MGATLETGEAVALGCGLAGPWLEPEGAVLPAGAGDAEVEGAAGPFAGAAFFGAGEGLGGSGVAWPNNSETVTNLKCFSSSCWKVDGMASTVPR